jgi:hypothetical protein
VILDAFAWLLCLLAVMDWTATVILVSVARRNPSPVLQERAASSVVLTIGATAVALLGAAHLIGFDFDPIPNFAFFVLALITISVPQLVWTAGYFMGKFR